MIETALLMQLFVYVVMAISSAALVLSMFHVYIAYITVNEGTFKSVFKRTLAAILLVGLGWAVLATVANVEGWEDLITEGNINAIASLVLCGFMLYISIPHSKIKELFE